MNSRMIARALAGILITPIAFGVPLFLAAGTANYWEGWLFIAVFSVLTALHTLFLIKTDPELLERRMRAGPSAEKRPVQQIVMIVVIAAFFMLVIVSGFDHRFGWSHVPSALVFAGQGLIAFSYFVFYLVFRDNRFASATIELSEGQKVISTGLYAIVRHPMYAGALPLMVGIPLALGSVWGLAVLLLAMPALHLRIVDEERFLDASLPGYEEYRHKVKHRLIPGLY